MSLSKRRDADRKRGERQSLSVEARMLREKVISLEAENTLLRAILGRQENTGYSWVHELEQDKLITQLQADLARLEMMMDSMLAEGDLS